MVIILTSISVTDGSCSILNEVSIYLHTDTWINAYIPFFAFSLNSLPNFNFAPSRDSNLLDHVCRFNLPLTHTSGVIFASFQLSLSSVELVYEDVFRTWETIWAAEYICSRHFVLFIAAALVQLYRDVIIANNMDFTDISKWPLVAACYFICSWKVSSSSDVIINIVSLCLGLQLSFSMKWPKSTTCKPFWRFREV